MRRYVYVGPADVRALVASSPRGHAIHVAADLARLVDGEPMTFIVDVRGILHVAPRRSEHVACAGGDDVLSAGELIATCDRDRVRVTDISNQSTGYGPEPESWPAVAKALDDAGIAHDGSFTYEATFRRCPSCKQRNLVKEDWFECAMCGNALPRTWNFDVPDA